MRFYSVLGWFLACLYNLFDFCNGHGWAHCTNYDGKVTGNDYNDDNCLGYPRGWSEYNSTFFGQDRGASYQTSSNTIGNWCGKSLGTPSLDYNDSYTTQYPKATYIVGNTYRVVWPAKNHASYDCLSDRSDKEMRLKVYTTVNPATDPQSDGQWQDVINWHSGYDTAQSGIDGIPYQNCPNYCKNSDTAMCYGDFTLSSIFPQDGIYIFMWYWAYEDTLEAYTTCWEAYVETTGGDGSTPPASNNITNDKNATNYKIEFPICIKNASQYNEIKLINTINNTYNNQFSFNVKEINDINNDDSSWNVTIYSILSNKTDGITIDTLIQDNTLCDEIENSFTHSICDICDDVIFYSLYSSNSDGTDTNDDNNGGNTNGGGSGNGNGNGGGNTDTNTNSDEDGNSESSKNNGNSDSDDDGVVIAIVLVVVAIVIAVAALVFYQRVWKRRHVVSFKQASGKQKGAAFAGTG